MCRGFGWMFAAASISGLIQSILWMGFGLAGALVYLCYISISPYKEKSDFFRVTFIKLYFEGPKCIPDGSYLGKFNEDYKSVINLFTQDRVFAFMIAQVILNAVYFILSIMFYKRRNCPTKRGIALGWSAMSLVLCALDAAFCCAMIFDVLSLSEYLSDNSENISVNLREIVYIPLTLALVSSRFIAGWLWNFIIGGILFLDALCCRNIIKKPAKHPKRSMPDKVVEKVKEDVEESQKSKEVPKRNLSVINGYNSSHVPPFHEYSSCRMSVEATTKFNGPEKPPSIRETRDWDWDHPAKESIWNPEPYPSKEWKMTNEGYVGDEEEKRPDFDHDLRNFERGQRKITIVKPPLGKPVDPIDKMNPFGNETTE